MYTGGWLCEGGWERGGVMDGCWLYKGAGCSRVAGWLGEGGGLAEGSRQHAACMLLPCLFCCTPESPCLPFLPCLTCLLCLPCCRQGPAVVGGTRRNRRAAGRCACLLMRLCLLVHLGLASSAAATTPSQAPQLHTLLPACPRACHPTVARVLRVIVLCPGAPCRCGGAAAGSVHPQPV